jgi:hypothetical protein
MLCLRRGSRQEAAEPKPYDPACDQPSRTCNQHATVQVKLLKCLVDGIVVDVSFNQLGGLFTLAFLEEVDVAIGGDHIFKRSIVLVSGLGQRRLATGG